MPARQNYIFEDVILVDKCRKLQLSAAEVENPWYLLTSGAELAGNRTLKI